MDENSQIDLNNNDAAQQDLEQQLDQAVAEGEQEENPLTTDNQQDDQKVDEGASPDLGTAKEQMNQEDGIEIL